MICQSYLEIPAEIMLSFNSESNNFLRLQNKSDNKFFSLRININKKTKNFLSLQKRDKKHISSIFCMAIRKLVIAIIRTRC